MERIVDRGFLKLGFALLASLLVSGCFGTGMGPVGPNGGSGGARFQERPTVVAVLDSGINPYHAAFAARSLDKDAVAFASTIPNVTTVRLAQSGDWKERVKADEATWKSIHLAQLVAFEGTRVLGITFGNDNRSVTAPDAFFSTPSFTQILDDTGHGTQTSGVIAREDPDAIIVMVQVVAGACDPGQQCLADPSMAAGMEWAASQPWVDVISASLGQPGNPPTNGKLAPEGVRYLAASKAAGLSGKIVIDSSGNYVSPTVPSYFSGPPWVIAVGGFEPAQKGERPEASKMVDVVANYTDYMPNYQDTQKFSWGTGTSFACPNVAGVLSRALYQVRADLQASREGPGGFPVMGAKDSAPKVTAKIFRDALNESAEYVAPTSWDAIKPTSNSTSPFLMGKSLPVLVSPAQMGWGYVTGAVVSKIVERVEASARGTALGLSHDAVAQAYQAQYQDARERYWSSALS